MSVFDVAVDDPPMQDPPNWLKPIGIIGMPKSIGPGIQIPSDIKIKVEWDAPFDFGPLPTPLKCTCDIMDLMARGCKCGQFAREQAAKK